MPSSGRKKSESPGQHRQQRNMELAACWVEDALAGRLESGRAQLLGQPRWVQQAFDVNSSERWEFLLMCLAVVLLLATFDEPPRSFLLACGAASEARPWLLTEALILSLFWVDLGLKVAYMSWRRWWKKTWHRLYIVSIALLTLGVAVGAVCGTEPTRWVRPALVLLRNREQRRIATSLMHLLSGRLGVALALTLAVGLLAGALGCHIFAPQYSDEEAAGDAWPGTFSNMFAATLELWVLVSSAENWPAIAKPAIQGRDGSHAALLCAASPNPTPCRADREQSGSKTATAAAAAAAASAARRSCSRPGRPAAAAGTSGRSCTLGTFF